MLRLLCRFFQDSTIANAKMTILGLMLQFSSKTFAKLRHVIGFFLAVVEVGVKYSFDIPNDFKAAN